MAVTKTKVDVGTVEVGDRVQFPHEPDTTRTVTAVRQDEDQPHAPISIWTLDGAPIRHSNPDRPTNEIRVNRGRQWVWCFRAADIARAEASYESHGA